MIKQIDSSNQQNFCGVIRDNGLYKEYLSHLPKKDLAAHNKLIKKITDMNDGRDFFISKFSFCKDGTTYKYYALNEQFENKKKLLSKQLFTVIRGENKKEICNKLKNLFEKPFKNILINLNQN